MENNDSASISNAIVELENVAISLDGEPLLKDVSLRLDEGEFAYLIGKSGAGKTSLLRSLYADMEVKVDVSKGIPYNFPASLNYYLLKKICEE